MAVNSLLNWRTGSLPRRKQRRSSHGSIRFRPTLDRCESRESANSFLTAGLTGVGLGFPFDGLAAMIDQASLETFDKTTWPEQKKNSVPRIESELEFAFAVGAETEGELANFTASLAKAARSAVSAKPESGIKLLSLLDQCHWPNDADLGIEGITNIEDFTPSAGTLEKQSEGVYDAMTFAPPTATVGFARTPAADPDQRMAGPIPGITATASEDESEPLPNQSPSAVNDFAATLEDQSVDINVFANDSDPDPGDHLHLATWDDVTGKGTISQPSVGTLRYKPNRDFNGTDVFNYTIVDDRGTSATATVTVTVTPVNEECVAFNDAAVAPTRVLNVPGSVLGNDIDFDRPDATFATIRVLAVDTAGMPGTLDFDFQTGNYVWWGPNGFTGTTQFRYQITDDHGSISDWATVTIIVAPEEIPSPPPILTANSDAFPVGDNLITQGVMGNDSNGLIAILNGHPASGRLTSFSNGGVFDYAPPLVPTNVSFTYTLYSEYAELVEANVLIYDLQMDIYDGQSGRMVPRELRSATGAFTVANLNDTNGDGTPDITQNSVTIAAGDRSGRSSEVDLMKLVLVKPNDPNPAENQVTLTLSGGAALWNESTKGSAAATQFQVAQLPKTLWVEATQASTALRDISITMRYRNETTQVTATGVWAQFTQFINTGTGDDAVPATMDGKDILKSYKDKGKQLGSAHQSPTRNLAVIEFRVSPNGIGEEKGIKFDVTRIKETKSWDWNAAGQRVPILPWHTFPSFRDNPNDDGGFLDEDNLPKDELVYAFDSPGFITVGFPDIRRKEIRQNFFEFVRVLFEKPGTQAFRNLNGLVEGSRASAPAPWRSRVDFTRNQSDEWLRTVGGLNEILHGPHTDLGN